MVRVGGRIWTARATGALLHVASWVTRWSRAAEKGYGAGRPCQHGLPDYN